MEFEEWEGKSENGKVKKRRVGMGEQNREKGKVG